MPNKDEEDRIKKIASEDQEFNKLWNSIVGRKPLKLCKCGLYKIEEDEKMCSTCRILKGDY